MNAVGITLICLLWVTVIYVVLFFKKKYCEKDLVSFGNYLLSEIRAGRIMGSSVDDSDYTERAQVVHDADLENWFHERE